MGTQRPVKIGLEEAPFGGEEMSNDLGGPKAEHHGKKKEIGKSKSKKVAEEIKEKKFQEEVKPVAEPESKLAKPQKTKKGKAKVRSKRYQEAKVFVDAAKKYNLEEAIGLVKKTTLTKFDGNVEVHLRMHGKTGKPESARGTLKYPHPTGKVVKVVILDEKTIEAIEKSKKTDFDIAVAAPEMMARVAKLAKILGPKGKMPNPKSGTVASDPEKTKKELEGGLTEYKTDSYGIIHQVIGKVSSAPKMLEENYRSLIAVLPQDKIKSINLCATMGPAIKVLTH